MTHTFLIPPRLYRQQLKQAQIFKIRPNLCIYLQKLTLKLNATQICYFWKKYLSFIILFLLPTFFWILDLFLKNIIKSINSFEFNWNYDLLIRSRLFFVIIEIIFSFYSKLFSDLIKKFLVLLDTCFRFFWYIASF